MAEPARHFTVRSLAERWSVSDGHIYKEIARKKLGCIRIGNAIRIPERFVIAYEQRAEECPELSEINQNSILKSPEERRFSTFAGQKIADLNAFQRGLQMKKGPSDTYSNL